eukprot:888129-Rhodomonas_salina.2
MALGPSPRFGWVGVGSSPLKDRTCTGCEPVPTEIVGIAGGEGGWPSGQHQLRRLCNNGPAGPRAESGAERAALQDGGCTGGG